MDPVRTAVMNNRFQAIVEEASTVLYRTAHTTFAKLVQDFQCAVASSTGELLAYPSRSGANVFIGLSLRGILEAIDIDSLEPGDCVITNDPYSTDGVVTHLMDITMVQPIFYDGSLVAFGWAFVHASDIGGAVPGSVSPSSTEVFQEGTRIRPVKLYKAGTLNDDIKNLILDNSRIPADIWGDLQAIVAGLTTTEKRIHELCDRFGREWVEISMTEVIELGELRARNVIRNIPDGTYTFSDYLEGMNEGELTLVNLAMTVRDDEILFDFTGTDPQVAAAFNFVTGAGTHPYLVQAFIWYILTVDPTAPRNAGLLRPVQTIAPRGSLLNAELPAAGGARVVSSMRVYDCILGCLNAALPDGLIAAGPGMAGIIVVGGEDPINGGNRVTVINPICGGGGGRRNCDGPDAIEARTAYLRSVPAEVTEIETNIRVRQYALVPDSQSPGRYRSGAGVVLDLENVGLDATMTIRGMNRFVFQPWGVRGGSPGRLGEAILNPGTADEKSIGKVNVLQFRQGDTLRLVTPCGGGFGDPFTRDPQLVLSDVERGLLSRQRARDLYGVSIDPGGRIDDNESRRLRSEGAREGTEDLFDLGHARSEYESIWPPSVRARLAMAALENPASLRPHLISAVRDRLTAAGRRVDLEIVERTIIDVKASLGSRR